MTYKSGTLKWVTPPCEERLAGDWCDHDDHETGLEPGTIYLPHSCNEWVIGTPEDAAALIADLQVLLGALS